VRGGTSTRNLKNIGRQETTDQALEKRKGPHASNKLNGRQGKGRRRFVEVQQKGFAGEEEVLSTPPKIRKTCWGLAERGWGSANRGKKSRGGGSRSDIPPGEGSQEKKRDEGEGKTARCEQKGQDAKGEEEF